MYNHKTINELEVALMPLISALKPLKYLLMPLLVVLTLPFSWVGEKSESMINAAEKITDSLNK